MLEQVRNELERVYFSRGKYGVKVETTIEPQDHNRVNVSIAIDEGNAARIKAINIVGNHCFSSGELQNTFTLAPTNLLSWIFQRYRRCQLDHSCQEPASFLILHQ